MFFSGESACESLCFSSQIVQRPLKLYHHLQNNFNMFIKLGKTLVPQSLILNLKTVFCFTSVLSALVKFLCIMDNG